MPTGQADTTPKRQLSALLQVAGTLYHRLQALFILTVANRDNAGRLIAGLDCILVPQIERTYAQRFGGFVEQALHRQPDLTSRQAPLGTRGWFVGIDPATPESDVRNFVRELN